MGLKEKNIEDEIINNIIEIDKQAKSIFNEANNRNDNFDELVEDAIEKQKKIIDKEIEEKIQRGATGLYGKGMYTNKEKLVLMCAASRRDVARIKIIARKLDPSSFIIITNSREVVGLGFKKS